MSFKTFDLAHDVASLVSAINEVVSLSQSLFAPAFGGGSGDLNMKFFNNIASASANAPLGGYWQTVNDSSPTSSLSTPLLDIAYGFSTASLYNDPVSGLYASASHAEKIKVFREISSVLQGDADQPFTINGVPKTECFFIMVKRGLMKDELKKGSVQLILSGNAGQVVTATDAAAVTAFKQTVGGDYAPLMVGNTEVGQVWYNAGVIVLPASGAGLPWNLAEFWSGSIPLSGAGTASGTQAWLSIDDNVDGLRQHIKLVGFHNQTNLYSTVYFCRATNAEFNYSSNPTFLDDSKRIIVTSGSNVLQTRTYITTVGLYDANDNLLAVGKLNKPITKSPDNEGIFRIRLDY